MPPTPPLAHHSSPSASPADTPRGQADTADNRGPGNEGGLLSPLFMQSLDRLDVLSRKILSGKLLGDRRSKQRGQSVEFADYRPYVSGDDLRFIDWNLYARLDKLFLRLFMEEQDLSVSIAIDLSPSMRYGQPDKSRYARQLAAALGYIGLVNYNRVNLYAFTGDQVEVRTGLRGRQPIKLMLQFLATTLAKPMAGAAPLASFTRRLALANPGKGIIILVSDFMDKGDLAQAFKPLASSRWDVHAIHLLSPQELDPTQGQLTGDMRLEDMEDGQLTEITMSPELLKRYHTNLEAYCQHVRQSCLGRAMSYSMADTKIPFETLVLEHLRQRGLLG